MKKIRLFLALLMLVLVTFTSCDKSRMVSKDFSKSKAIGTNSYLITKESALSQLIQFAKTIPCTRGNSEDLLSKVSNLNISDLETISNGCNTRSSVASVSPEYYLVNFKDDKGFAILSADKRISSPVVCITDKGNFSSKYFRQEGKFSSKDTLLQSLYKNNILKSNVYYAANRNSVDDEPGKYFIGASLDLYYDNSIYRRKHAKQTTLTYADNSKDDDYGGGGPDNSNDDDYGGGGPYIDVPDTTIYSDWQIGKHVDALLDTKWHQDSPFNDCSPTRRKYILFGYKVKSPAGCGPIALAQVVAYNKYPSDYTVDGLKIELDKLREYYTYRDYKYGFQDNDVLKNEVAHFVRDMGRKLGTVYVSDKYGFTRPDKIPDALSSLGYKNVHYGYGRSSYKRSVAMLDNNKPVIVVACELPVDGHIWVIDGYRYVSRTKTVKKGSNVISKEDESHLLLHCNFGWGGECDGYYVSGVFDANNHPVMIDSIKDKKTGTEKFKADTWFRTITYDF